MRKKHNALVIDTETTMMNERPFLAYNIGGALGDIYSPDSEPLEFDFYVQEIISNPKNSPLPLTSLIYFLYFSWIFFNSFKK